jgi:hypothetical protein
MTQTILIDGDVLVYQVAFSVETPVYICGGGVYKRKGYAEAISKQILKDKGLEVPVVKRVNVGSEKELRANLKARIMTIMEDLGTDIKIYLTNSEIEENFRNTVATILPYKGNRAKSVKPVHYKRLREILISDFRAILVNGQEADDAMAIEQERLCDYHGNLDMSVIATIDKDLRTVPGWHYHLTKRSLEFVTPQEADKTFYRQILTGDVTDNIPGLTKLLKVVGRDEEANKLSYGHYLKKYDQAAVDLNPRQCYNKVLSMYQDHGFGEKEINEIGNLLWMRRYEGQIWSEDKETLLFRRYKENNT